MKKFAITMVALSLILALAAPALAWRVRVRPNVVVRVPALVISPAPVVVRPAPVVVRPAPKTVVVRPCPICPQGWHWNDWRERCMPNY